MQIFNAFQIAGVNQQSEKPLINWSRIMPTKEQIEILEQGK